MTSQPHRFDAPRVPEMATRLQTTDWSKTPLGPRESWPASLRIIVSVMLASGFPMCVRWGPELVMIYNDGYRSILGARHPRAFGLPFHEAWPEVQEQLRPVHQAILNGSSGAYFAEDLLIKVQRRGNPEWEDGRFTVSYSPVPDDSAPTGVGGVLVTVVETTDRVRTEEALRASEERFARIFEQTGVGVLQCELDGRFLLVNRRFCEIVGRSAEELLTLSVPDITHPDNRDSDAALRRQLLADAVPFFVEKRYLRPDGSEVWASVNVALMRSADGLRHQLIGVAQDITEQKIAEASLRHKEADLRLVLDSATDGVYCVDTDGITTMCNAAFLRMLGIAREQDAIGRKLHDVIHHARPDGSPYPLEECPIYRTARDGVPAHVPYELFYRLDGESFPVEYWVNPIRRDGAHQGAVCTFIDITERRRAQEQQNLLLRELNHRIKNLFAITGGLIALSARSAATPKDYAKSLGGRLDALALAHELILPAPPGEDTPKAEPARLDDLLEKILSPYTGKHSGGAGSRLDMRGPPIALGPQTVTTFALIIHELATNAAKYGSLSVEDGALRISWACDAQTLTMTWQETGGPAVAGPPTSEGFGTALSNHSVRVQLGGSLTHQWDAAGLSVGLSAPLQRLQD
ncbi:MAG: PAS domain S-box protein [Xanthobacteraceae bacterium]